MESKGAVFLPAAGYAFVNYYNAPVYGYNEVGQYGMYNGHENYKKIIFNDGIQIQNWSVYDGDCISIRYVQDVP